MAEHTVMKTLKSKLVIGLGSVLLLASGFLVKNLIDRHAKISEFRANRDTIMSSLNDSMKAGDYQNVVSLSKKYLIVNDERLDKLKRDAEAELLAISIKQKIEALLTKDKQTPESNNEEKLDIYEQLSSLHPDDKTYAKKVILYKAKHIQTLISELNDDQDEEKLNYYYQLNKLTSGAYDKQVMLQLGKVRYKKTLLELEKEGKIRTSVNSPRQNKITQQFSSWDGSHRNLEHYIKERMNDPSSFEQVKTTYIDKGDYLIVTTSFRGTNALGALVLNSVSAKVSLEGKILDIIN